MQGDCPGTRAACPVARRVGGSGTAGPASPLLSPSALAMYILEATGWTCPRWRCRHRGRDLSQASPLAEGRPTAQACDSWSRPVSLGFGDPPSHPGHGLRGRNKSFPGGGGYRRGGGKRRGKVGMRFPSGTEWGPPGNPRGPPRPRTQHHHQQLQTPALRGSQPEPGVVFKEMQFDLPSSFRNPAHRTLPGPAGLVAAAGAAAGTFSPSTQTCADILTRIHATGLGLEVNAFPRQCEGRAPPACRQDPPGSA